MYIPNCEAKIGRQDSPDTVLRQLLTTLFRQCSKSRERIAEELSLHAGQLISKHMLDDWTAESKKPARFPAFLIQSFSEVTGSDQLQRWVMGPRLRKLLEFAERELEVRELCRELLKSGKRNCQKSKKSSRPRKP